MYITPSRAEGLQHPQTIEMLGGVLHIRNVEGPQRTGSVETRLEAMEQQVFKCQEMVERGLDSNHMMIAEFTNNHKLYVSYASLQTIMFSQIAVIVSLFAYV